MPESVWPKIWFSEKEGHKTRGSYWKSRQTHGDSDTGPYEFDNSVIMGTSPVPTWLFKNGKPNKKKSTANIRLRLLKALMISAEVIRRRYSRSHGLATRPHYHGWSCQVNVAKGTSFVMKAESIYPSCRSSENDKHPKPMNYSLGILKELLTAAGQLREFFSSFTHLQDEVHCFATTFHCQVRKNSFSSQTWWRGGVRPKGKQKLLNTSSSMTAIRKLLLRYPLGIPGKVAEAC